MIRRLASAFLHEQGRRPYNEDSIFPDGPAQPGDRLFMVCDGVGRSNRGDMASSQVCREFPRHYARSSHSDPQARLNEALLATEEHLRELIHQDGSLAGMATTLTLVDLSVENPLVAWIGDSRVYHIRQGEVLFVTRDHSVVAELMARGEITPDQAKSHPKRNVITKAVTGEVPTEISSAALADVQAGDFIMLCSDGVSGCLDDAFIRQTFDASNSVDKVRSQVDRLCGRMSTDNYSMWLIKVEGEVTAPVRSRRSRGLALGIVLVIVLGVTAWFLVPSILWPTATDPDETGIDTSRPAPSRSILLPPVKDTVPIDTTSRDTI